MANLKSGSKKRKSLSSSSQGQGQGQASKKLKYRELAAQKLPWKALAKGGYDFDEDGGVLELEEVEDVDIVWQETAGGGRTAKFMVGRAEVDLKILKTAKSKWRRYARTRYLWSRTTMVQTMRTLWMGSKMKNGPASPMRISKILIIL
jgi:hypothetical protein